MNGGALLHTIPFQEGPERALPPLYCGVGMGLGNGAEGAPALAIHKLIHSGKVNGKGVYGSLIELLLMPCRLDTWSLSGSTAA